MQSVECRVMHAPVSNGLPVLVYGDLSGHPAT
jgi:hypothetical protein